MTKATRAHTAALESTGWNAVVSEQILEIPLVLRHLRADERTVLDFGGFESILPLSLSALGHQVTVFDQRKYPFSHTNLRTICRDIFADAAELRDSFDVVISISTIEHLGLGSYGDVTRPDGDRDGVARLWEFVRRGGRLLASVPVGRGAVHRGYRVYDETRLRRTFPHLSEALFFKKDGRNGNWRSVSSAEANDVSYTAPDESLPVEAIAFVICEKQ